MKGLIVLYNQARTYKTALKTYNVLKYLDCDVVIFTQNDTVSKSDLKKILPNAKIFLEDIDEYKNLDSEHISPTKHTFFKIKEYLNTVSGYDIIFINRLDSTMYIHNIKKFLEEFNNKKIYVQQDIVKGENEWFVPDHFFIGSEKVIKYYFENFEDTIDSHNDVAHYLDKLPFECGEWEDGTYSLHLRPNMEKFINENIDDVDFEQKIFHWLYVDKKHKILEAEWKGYKI